MSSRKPLNAVLRLQDVLSHPGLRLLLGGIRKLPPRPRTFARLQVMMSHKNVTPKKICAVIEADAAITAKVLQLANCAIFHDQDRVKKHSAGARAPRILGVRNLVMCSEVLAGWSRAAGSDLNLDAMQAHVQRVARVTAALTAGSPCSDEAVLAAFLHDIGYWILVQERPAELDRAAALAVTQDIPMHEAERLVLGTSHAEIGAYLLGLWACPTPWSKPLRTITIRKMPASCASTRCRHWRWRCHCPGPTTPTPSPVRRGAAAS